MRKIINESQRGLLFKDGKFIKMLVPGKYRYFRYTTRIEVVNISDEFKLAGYDMSVFLKDEDLQKQLSIVDVKDETLALH